MQTLTECVTERRSIRAYLDRPVPKETINELLELAKHSPSGNNMQPWFVHVLTGDALDNIKQKVQATMAENPLGEGMEYQLYPEKLGEPYRTRRFQCGEGMYETIGLSREDKLERLMQLAKNFEFFGAPVGLFFSIDRSFGPEQWAHLGMFIQTLMLLATERGLATCAQEAWGGMHKTVSETLKLPEEQMLYCGMSLGYADPDATINAFVTERVEIDQFASLHGF